MEALSSGLANIVAAIAAIAAAVVDVREYRVPNKLTGPLLALGVLYHGLAQGFAGLQLSLLGAACGFALLIVAYAIGILGAGDVKLAAGVGAWLGFPSIMWVVLCAAVAAIVYSFVVSLLRGVTPTWGAWRTVRKNLTLWICRMAVVSRHFVPDERVETVVARKDNRRYHLVPFAAMVAIGCVFVLVYSLL